MLTTTNREDAEAYCQRRNDAMTALGIRDNHPDMYTVIEGPGDGEYTAMTFRDADSAGHITMCDGCYDGTPHGHMCDDGCDGCYRLRGVVGGCACADDDAPVTLRAMRLEARS